MIGHEIRLTLVRSHPRQARRRIARASGCADVASGRAAAIPATHRAPKGRLHENEYWRFCLDHVREYNHSYNYFCRHERRCRDRSTRRMRSPAIARPGRWAWATPASADFGPDDARDPFNVFREFGGGPTAARPSASSRSARCATPSARRCTSLGSRKAPTRRDQGALQAPGEAASSRRQRRRPRQRGQAARDHPGLQLSQVDRRLLSAIVAGRGRPSRARAPRAAMRQRRAVAAGHVADHAE